MMTICQEGKMDKIRKYSKNIKRLRISLGMTQVEFGRLIDKSYTDISRYENGSVSPSYATAKKICGLAQEKFPTKYIFEDFIRL
jgi:transcriptional regulator with XRE-family HTH domain